MDWSGLCTNENFYIKKKTKFKDTRATSTIFQLNILSGMSWRQFLFKNRVVCGKIEL